VVAINRALSLELEPGVIKFSVGAQIHSWRNHPEDFFGCLPHLQSVVSFPLYVGDDFKNRGKIELINRISALGGGLLVAVCLEKEEDGYYHVASFYPISETKIRNRLENRFLRRIC
jgi:hypothetical protein